MYTATGTLIFYGEILIRTFKSASESSSENNSAHFTISPSTDTYSYKHCIEVVYENARSHALLIVTITDVCDSHLLEDVHQLRVASQQVLPHILLQTEGAICLH